MIDMTTLFTYVFDNEQDLLKVVQVLNEKDASYSVNLKDQSIRITEVEASRCGFFSILSDKYKYKLVLKYVYGSPI